jgi:hypothetical protein
LSIPSKIAVIVAVDHALKNEIAFAMIATLMS